MSYKNVEVSMKLGGANEIHH
uniref:Uncharacterized protein n=1 Tax=Rhizophora mucronata TaxID=61149 RepID=A0A2P2PZW0_RHIMU